MSRKRTKQTTASDELPADISMQPGWRRARHTADPTTTKLPTRRVTINLDADIVAMFKADAFRGGPPYQVAINQALRAYLRSQQMSESERAAETVLKALDQGEVIRKLRQLLR